MGVGIQKINAILEEIASVLPVCTCGMSIDLRSAFGKTGNIRMDSETLFDAKRRQVCLSARGLNLENLVDFGREKRRRRF